MSCEHVRQIVVSRFQADSIPGNIALSHLADSTPRKQRRKAVERICRKYKAGTRLLLHAFVGFVDDVDAVWWT